MKNKISFIALCMISVILLSCKHTASRHGEPDCFGIYKDEIFKICVRDSKGNDLLDPSNPNGYNIDSIRVYYLLTDGTLHKGQTYYEFEKGVARNPGDYELVRGKDGYLLDFMLSTIHSIKRENKYPMMCIYWNKKDRDIIRSKLITRRGNPQDPTDAGYCVFITWDTVWYNDKIIATDWKETKKRLLSPPVIIKGSND